MQDRFKFKIAVFERFNNRGWEFQNFIEDDNNWHLTTCGDVASNNCYYAYYNRNNAPDSVHMVYEPIFCTGLKDKNGNLIYEGDIVKEFYLTSTMQPMERTEQVKYNQERCCFTVGTRFFAPDAVYTILGNIYENKELLND